MLSIFPVFLTEGSLKSLEKGKSRGNRKMGTVHEHLCDSVVADTIEISHDIHIGEVDVLELFVRPS